MAETGLRDLRKSPTRRHIAERGYEQVTAGETARGRGGEQTLYGRRHPRLRPADGVGTSHHATGERPRHARPSGAISPSIHRLTLESADRQAAALSEMSAAALEIGPVCKAPRSVRRARRPRRSARLQGAALSRR